MPKLIADDLDDNEFEELKNKPLQKDQKKKSKKKTAVSEDGYGQHGAGHGTHFDHGVLKLATVIDDTGRYHMDAEEEHDDDQDPLQLLWHLLGVGQQINLPLLLGVFLAIIIANSDPDAYARVFGDGVYSGEDDDTVARVDGAYRAGDFSENRLDQVDQWTLPVCSSYHSEIAGHLVSLKFVANDIVMAFYFGLATKEFVEAVQPGGSFNPPHKAVSALAAALGGILGPVIVYLILLDILAGSAGAFGENPDMVLLQRGWAAVTSTDMLLSWAMARMVFKDGHPAIDYLLLVGVVANAFGLIALLLFYPDPKNDWEPVGLLYVLAGVAVSFALRKWHYRIEKVRHQSWFPYVVFGGGLCWIGLNIARLHPSLALVFVVPFMPGPMEQDLEHMDDDFETVIEKKVMDTVKALAKDRMLNEEQEEFVIKAAEAGLQREHDVAGGHGHEVEAGMYAGILGHHMASALKVTEYDEDGVAHAYASTLDSFEMAIKPLVDYGIVLFTLCNAGVDFGKGFNLMGLLIGFSLVVGKTVGVYFFADFVACIGYPAPLGVRTSKLATIGLLSSIGLTGSLFFSDAAFVGEAKLLNSARLGTLVATFFSCVASYYIGKGMEFEKDDITIEATKQIEDFIKLQVESGRMKAPKDPHGQRRPEELLHYNMSHGPIWLQELLQDPMEDKTLRPPDPRVGRKHFHGSGNSFAQE